MNNEQQKLFFQYLATVQTPNGTINQSMGLTTNNYPSNRDLVKKVTQIMTEKNLYVTRVDILSFNELSKQAYCAFFELDPETV